MAAESASGQPRPEVQSKPEVQPKQVTLPNLETLSIDSPDHEQKPSCESTTNNNNNDKSSNNDDDDSPASNPNLIVNYLPNALTDDEFFQIFEKIGPLTSAKIMRNKMTGYSYGYGFVSFASSPDAAEAIRQLDGAQLQYKRLKVAYCRRGVGGDNNADQIKNANLFIANLPSNISEDELEEAFGKFGEIVRSKILIDHATGVSKGCGFVLFSKTAEADKALTSLNGKLLDLPGFHFTHPLIVKKAKDENRGSYDGASGAATSGAATSGAATSATAARNGGPAASGNLRALPVHVFHHYAPPTAAPIAGKDRDVNVSLEGSVGSVVQRHDAAALIGPALTATGAGEPAAGPLGHTLYVYGIGSMASELDLYALFAPFGAIVKVYVMRDPAIRTGKGFGFVTYGDYHDACLAVQTLNGYPFHKNSMRPLQVSFKTPKSSVNAVNLGYPR